MHISKNLDRSTVDIEAGSDLTVPHVKGLVYVRNLVRPKISETDRSEMETVGIDTEPIGRIVLTTEFVKLHRIRFLTATAEIIILQGFIMSQVLRIRETVPAPL